MHRPRSRVSIRRLLLATTGALVLAFSMGSAFAHHPPSVTVQQYWDLLAETREGILADTTIPIQRGTLPGATSGFSPQPTGSLFVQARHSGAVNSAAGVWWLRLKVQDVATGTVSTLATGAWQYFNSSYTLQEFSFTWPSADKRLVSFEVTKESGSVPSTFDLRRAYIAIRQQGTPTKTIGRVPMAAKQLNITSSSATRVAEPAFYTHIPADFDPAPTVRLRASGAANSGSPIHVRLAPASGSGSVAGSELVFTSTEVTSLESGPLTLSAGTTYAAQVWVVSLPGGQSSAIETPDDPGLYSAELVLAQSTADSHGIAKTVGWYPGMTAAADATSNNQVLNFKFKAPGNTVPTSTATFEVVAKRLSGSGQVGASLDGVSGSSTPVTVDGSYVHLTKSLPSLPSAGQELDTRATLNGTGTTGRFSMSRIRQTIDLHDLIPPQILSPLSATQMAISPNGDGVKDATTLTASLGDFSPITWSIAIKNASGATVRTSPPGSGTSVSWSWDGKNASVPAQPVGDGTYSATLTATDSPGNVSTSVLPGIIVDTVAPSVTSVAVTPTRFSPNGDTYLDTASFTGTISESLPWTLRVKASPAGSTVGIYIGSGASVSQPWDGLFVADGNYVGELEAFDAAGNRGVGTSGIVTRDATGPSFPSYEISQDPFSPNGDGIKDSVTITAGLLDAWTPISWTLDIKDSAGVVQRSYSGSTASVSQVWDGKDAAGNVVPDGPYTIALTGIDGGLSKATSLRSVVVDVAIPDILGYQAMPNPFSPSAAAPKNTTTLSGLLTDSVSWTLEVKDAQGTLVRSLPGAGPQVSAAWDGRNTSGSVVANGPYRVSVVATDAAGNVADDAVWVTLGPAPVISSISPGGPVQPGARVTITGSNFGTGIGSYGVSVDGRSAFISSWTSTQIVADLPSGVQPGEAEVAVWTTDISSIAVPLEIANFVYPPVGAPMVQGSIAVRMVAGADPALVAVRNGNSSSDIQPEFPGVSDPVLARWYRVTVPVGQERTKAELYAADTDVEVAEVHAPFTLDRNTDDPQFGNQWSLEQSNDIDIDAKTAWDKSIGSTSIVIAIVDSGIGPHADIVANRLPGKSYDTNSTFDNEECVLGFSHGTFVAGIASADTNNNKGISGVGWRTKVRPYRVFRWEIDPNSGVFDCRSTLGTGVYTLGDVLTDVVANGDDVVNMSFSSSAGPYFQEQDAVNYAWNNGVVLVASAGNRGAYADADEPRYPAAYDNVLAVGAHDQTGSRSSFSSRGDWVDLYAPGRDIRSTRRGWNGSQATETYEDANGTSFSTPIVAGTAALLLDRGVNNHHAVSAITNTLVGSLGRLNANDALARAAAIDFPNGTWIKDRRDNQPQVYFIDGQKKRPVTAAALSSWGIEVGEVVKVPKAELDNYPLWEDSLGRPFYIGFRPGTLIAPVPGTDDQLNPPPALGTYVTSNDRESGASQRGRWLNGWKYRLLPTFFACLNYETGTVRSVSVFESSRHPSAPAPNSDWIDCTKHPNGTVLRRTTAGLGVPEAWILQDGKKRWMKAPTIVASWGLNTVVEVVGEIDGLAPGSSTGYRPGDVLRVTGPSIRWAITPDGTDWARGNKRQFSPVSAYLCFGYVGEVRPEDRNYPDQLHPTSGTTLTC